MLSPATLIGPGRYRCHRCGSPNLYRDYDGGGEILACLMCGERMGIPVEVVKPEPVKQEVVPMAGKPKRCANCGREAQLSGPLCVGICYLAARGKTGEAREAALREARERVERGDYRGGAHWDGSRKVEARQRKAMVASLNGVVLRMEIALAKGREILEEMKRMGGAV